MDGSVDLPEDHTESYHYFMHDNLFNHMTYKENPTVTLKTSKRNAAIMKKRSAKLKIMFLVNRP